MPTRSGGVSVVVFDEPAELASGAIVRALFRWSGHNSVSADTCSQNPQLRAHELDVRVVTGREKTHGQGEKHLEDTLQRAPSFREAKRSQRIDWQVVASMRIYWNPQEMQCKRPVTMAGREG